MVDMKTKEIITRDEYGKIVAHDITISKEDYDNLISDKKVFLQALLTAMIDIDVRLNEDCRNSWRDMSYEAGRESWLRYLSEKSEQIREAFIQYVRKELQNYEEDKVNL